MPALRVIVGPSNREGAVRSETPFIETPEYARLSIDPLRVDPPLRTAWLKGLMATGRRVCGNLSLGIQAANSHPEGQYRNSCIAHRGQRGETGDCSRWQFQSRKTMLAWHYTTGRKFQHITASGILVPADTGVEPPEKPVLGFRGISIGSKAPARRRMIADSRCAA